MPTLRVLDGKLVARDGKLATDDKCCCGCCCVDGEADPTKTTEAECTDAGGYWFPAQADCDNVTCDGCACVFPLDQELEVKFTVTVNGTSCGNDVHVFNITLAEDNVNGYYIGHAQAAVGSANVDVWALFGCGGDIADTFGIPAGQYWSTVQVQFNCGTFIDFFDAQDIDDFAMHNIFVIGDKCIPDAASGTLDTQGNGTTSWTAWVE